MTPLSEPFALTTDAVRNIVGGDRPESVARRRAHFEQWLRSVKAEALREAADDSTLRLRGHSGISIRGLRDRAARIEQGGDSK